MEDKQTKNRRVCSISVPDYLARYARLKFDTDPKTGGIRIPDSFNLYHCVWHAMAKWPLERWHVGVMRRVETAGGNLTIHLPDRRSPEDGHRKNPRYWNYISPRSARVIAAELKRLFDWEFHHYVENLLEYRDDVTKKEAVRRFARKYSLGIDAEDALIKNFQRHERKTRLFLGLNKRKIAWRSPTDLSSPRPPLLRFTQCADDGRDLCGCESPLARVITQGLELMGESGEVANPNL